MTTTLQSVVERVLREYLNVAVEPGPAGLTVICPYHDDHKASGHLKCDESDPRFNCFACDASKSFVQYVSRVKGLDEHTVRQDIERLYGFETDSTIIPIAVVEAYHKEIFGNEGMLTELRARGLTDTTIKRYRLGFNSGRIQIPVANRYGLIVNLRKYKPGAESKHKMRNQGKCAIEETAYDVTAAFGTGVKGKVYLIPSSIKAGEIARVLREGYDVGLLNDGFDALVKNLGLDLLFIDTHPGLSVETLLSIAISDILVLIMRPDQQDYQGTSVTVEVARKLYVPQMLLMVNKVPEKWNANEVKQNVEKTYDCEVAAVIPHSDDLMTLASSGIFSSKYPDHPVTKIYQQLATRILA